MSRRAFSLVEMIVVMGILIVLVSILMPVVSSARDAANGTLCESHIRTLTQAFLAFAAEHDGHLPGAIRNNVAWTWTNASGAIIDSRPPDTAPDHADWLFGVFTGNGGGDMTNLLPFAPQYGTIWKYVNNNSNAVSNLPDGGSFATYRCPSLTVTSPGSSNTGAPGSNGRFDYAAFAIFNGASLKDIPATTIMHYVVDPDGKANQFFISPNPTWAAKQWATVYAVMPTPLICQEDPKFAINSTNMEGEHCEEDQMAHLHRGGCFYGSIDGSANWVNEPNQIIKQYWFEGTHVWEAVEPSGNTCSLDFDKGIWNYWALQ